MKTYTFEMTLLDNEDNERRVKIEYQHYIEPTDTPTGIVNQPTVSVESITDLDSNEQLDMYKHFGNNQRFDIYQECHEDYANRERMTIQQQHFIDHL